MKTNLLLLACVLTAFLSAQTTADFENITLAADTFLNGSDANGGFSSGNVYLNNEYSVFPTYTTWSGFSISNVVNTTSSGFSNQYACISGSGYANSANYAVSYQAGESVLRLDNAASGGGVEGFYINNSTYAFLSMQDGDGFAKQFGGATGDEEDFFLLTVEKFLDGARGTEKVEFYLADYRFSDNTQDYIIEDWTYVDLSSLGNADSLSFTLTSSDNDVQFGMNTPAYFCMDNFITKDALVSGIHPVINDAAINFYPNPVQSALQINNLEKNATKIVLINAIGQQVVNQKLNFGSNSLQLASLNSGVYWGSVLFEDGSIYNTKVVKN